MKNDRKANEGVHRGTPNESSSANVQGPTAKGPGVAEQRKLEVEAGKLELETRKLQFDLSWKARVFAGMTGIGALATSLGIIGTLWLGINQLRQTQISRDDERFERSVSRLASQSANERLTGLAGIQQFLTSSDPSRQESTLTYLVNAVVIEKEPTTRSAILDLFNSLPNLSKQALDHGLVAARDRNRSVLKRLTAAFLQQQTQAKQRLTDPVFTEVPIGDPPPEERAPLEASAQVMASLVRAGARVDDLSGVYCVECKFSTFKRPAALHGVNFENAFLRRADFSGADLSFASFHNADLILADFTSANLESANLTEDTALQPWSVTAALYSGEMANLWGANFACSNLSYADFAGRIAFSLVYENPVYGGNMHDEFYNADLHGTKLRAMRFMVAIPEALVPLPKPGTIVNIPPSFAPTSVTVATPADISVNYFGGPKYVIWYGEQLDGTGQRIKPLPSPYRRDLVISLSSFALGDHFKSGQQLSLQNRPTGLAVQD